MGKKHRQYHSDVQWITTKVAIKADAMFAARKYLVATVAWPTIRWSTQHFINKRGRAFYDRYIGGASGFIMIQWNHE